MGHAEREEENWLKKKKQGLSAFEWCGLLSLLRLLSDAVSSACSERGKKRFGIDNAPIKNFTSHVLIFGFTIHVLGSDSESQPNEHLCPYNINKMKSEMFIIFL